MQIELQKDIQIQIWIIWTGSGTERGYQMRLQQGSLLLSIVTWTIKSSFFVASYHGLLIWVKWFLCWEYRTGSWSGEKSCAFVLNDVASDLWAFWTKEKVPDTCTALLVVSFVSLYLYKLTKETTYSAVHVSGSIKAFPFRLLLKFNKGQRI